MTSKWDRLRVIVAERSFSQGDSFMLASGKSSTFYFDMKLTMLDPEGANLLGELILEKTASLGAAYVAGLAMGAGPGAVAVAMTSQGTATPMQAFYVRKEVKGHGTRKRADGYLPDDSDVLIVEDVTTTGGSALQAIEEVRSRGCRVKAVATIVDREDGARERLLADGIELISLFKTSDFLG